MKREIVSRCSRNITAIHPARKKIGLYKDGSSVVLAAISNRRRIAEERRMVGLPDDGEESSASRARSIACATPQSRSLKRSACLYPLRVLDISLSLDARKRVELSLVSPHSRTLVTRVTRGPSWTARYMGYTTDRDRIGSTPRAFVSREGAWAPRARR